MKFFQITCFIFAIALMGWSAEIGPSKENLSNIRIVPVEPTPEPDNVEVFLTFPKAGQILYSGSGIGVQAQLQGFNVGTNSTFERSREIYNDPDGQSLLVFIDDYHPIEIYRSFVDALDPNNLYYNWTLTITLPFDLSEGMHVIRAFPDRSYGESVKGPGSYAARIFYVGEKRNNLDVDLSAPYLTYNEPLQTLRYTSKKPLLLDFYLSNIQLSRDGYKVRVTINGNVERMLTQWVPYYIYGLTSGSHTIQLELLDERNQLVPGLFNRVKRTIHVD